MLIVDIHVGKEHKGITYLLADYAKSVNGGKEIKLSKQQWQSIMKVVSDINSKRDAGNIIFSGGDNLFGKASENFIIKSGVIKFSDEEMALILNEMGVKTPLKPKAVEDLPMDPPIKGLSIEHTPANEKPVQLAKAVEEAPDIAQEPQNQAEIEPDEEEFEPETDYTFNYENGFNNKQSFYPTFNPIINKPYSLESLEALKLEPTIVTAAQDTINLAPPFEIKAPKVGKRGGTTKTISHELHNKLMQLSDEINCNYEDLIAVMNFESGIDPHKGSDNPKKPVGLIQFTKFSIKALNKNYGLNLTKEDIAQMSAEEQIDLVSKYLKLAKNNSSRLRNKPKLDAADLYSMVILPGRAGCDPLCKKGETNKDGKLLNYYESNSPIDVTHDDVISRADVLTTLDAFRVNVKVV